MAITIKPTEIADIDAIFALRNDPDVLRHQYQPRKGETPASFKKKLAGRPNVLGISFRCTSIFDDCFLVGHVMQYFGPGPEGGRRSCECGWNLAKSHWGQGVMPRALTELFAQLFDEDPRLVVFASCFASNHRSRRVIEKLGFEPDRMHWMVWLTHLVRSHGRRIEQYRLDRLRFRRAVARMAPPNESQR